MTEARSTRGSRCSCALADDELIIGHRHSEWTGWAPHLEEDLAFSSIAQDEMAHARLLYGLVGGDAGRTGRRGPARARPRAGRVPQRRALRAAQRGLGLLARPAVPVRHGRRGPARGARVRRRGRELADLVAPDPAGGGATTSTRAGRGSERLAERARDGARAPGRRAGGGARRGAGAVRAAPGRGGARGGRRPAAAERGPARPSGSAALGEELEAASLDYVLERHAPRGRDGADRSSGEVRGERASLAVPGSSAATAGGSTRAGSSARAAGAAGTPRTSRRSGRR